MHFPCRSYDGDLPPFVWRSSPDAAPRVYQPCAIWRYLGFYFDPRLSFRHHINFYATRALSTVRSYPLLGNANRGLSPLNKRTLYISCVLPLLTYGARLWLDPRRSQSTLIKPLRTAQASAARWILGAFRTSPIGGMEILAGLLPIHLHLRKLYKRSHLRVSLLPDSHVLKRALPLPLVSRVPLSFTYGPAVRRIPKNPSLPLHLILPSLPKDLELFLPTHAECFPGQRLLDTHRDRIQFHTSHPKKSSPLFAQWLETFRFDFVNIQNDLSVLYAFSDGSVLSSNRSRSAAAIRAFRGNQELLRRALSCGRTTPYDAELFGLFTAIHHLSQHDASAIHLYCDNESALHSLFDTRLHTSQMLSVMACRTARTWLEANPARTIHLHWCPGHSGVEHNEAVDRDARRAALSLQPISHISLAHARRQITAEATKEWQHMALQPSYTGRGFLSNRKLRRVSHVKGGPTLSIIGDNIHLTARYARAVLNHAPTGEYRTRFFPNENPLCNWCPPIQTRRHILSTCVHYQRPRANFEEFLKNSAEPGGSLISFLKQNPTAFTFTDAPVDEFF